MWKYTNTCNPKKNPSPLGIYDTKGKLYQLKPGESVTIDRKYEPRTILKVEEVRKEREK